MSRNLYLTPHSNPVLGEFESPLSGTFICFRLAFRAQHAVSDIECTLSLIREWSLTCYRP